MASLDQDELQVLRALFRANEVDRPTIHAFRVQHRAQRRVIDRLLERKYIRVDGDRYRLTLRGLQEVDLDEARRHIALFNQAIPALQAAYGASEKGSCTRADLLSRMNLPGKVEEGEAEEALKCLLSDTPGGCFTGWSMDAAGSLMQIGLGEAILDLEPLPLGPLASDPSRSREAGESSQAEFLSMPSRVNGAVRVFVSHSSRDKHLVEIFVDLLVAALNIPKSDIRCTSVAGCRLPAGSEAKGVLVEDIRASEVFIALVTEESAEAPFVLFEMGARWGQRQTILPVLGPGADYKLLPSPVRDLHALKTEDEADMMQLMREVARSLSLEPQPTDAYLRQLKSLIAYRPASK